MRASLMTGAMLMLLSALAYPAAAAPTWQMVAQELGKPGTELPGGVYRIGLTRSDLKVTLDGVEIMPALALGSWLAFQAAGDEVMVMGDLVLTEDEVNPVVKQLAESGIAVTALHNHLLRAQPATMYIHVDGHGDGIALAKALHAALALTKTPLGPSPSAASQAVALDTSALDGIIGYPGKANGGVYQFAIPRSELVTAETMTIPASMGTGIAINFQPTGNGKAAITGDFVLMASEVNPVLRALRENNIEVTAVHNHMLNDQPRLFFMHFWANDDAAKLARGLKAALDKVNLAKS